MHLQGKREREVDEHLAAHGMFQDAARCGAGSGQNRRGQQRIKHRGARPALATQGRLTGEGRVHLIRLPALTAVHKLFKKVHQDLLRHLSGAAEGQKIGCKGRGKTGSPVAAQVG